METNLWEVVDGIGIRIKGSRFTVRLFDESGYAKNRNHIHNIETWIKAQIIGAVTLVLADCDGIEPHTLLGSLIYKMEIGQLPNTTPPNAIAISQKEAEIIIESLKRSGTSLEEKADTPPPDYLG